jgi:hypothetical protein
MILTTQQKTNWITVLRNGTYAQGGSLLRDIYNNYSSLGVLCDLLLADLNATWTPDYVHGYYIYTVDNKIGICDIPFELENTNFSNNQINNSPILVSVLNDSRISFQQVADILEANLSVS